MEAFDLSWDELLEAAIAKLCDHLPKDVADKEHLAGTPKRVADSFVEYFAGCWQDPAVVLKTGFNSKNYDEMVYVNNIGFVSFCAHHLVPFMGRVHFAYIPGRRIVGLSKIPRLIEIYAKRPQIQERFTVQLVDTFSQYVKPRGCGVVVEAYHLCMAIRGVKKEEAYTRTTALRGCFRKHTVKSEFLDGVRSCLGGELWP